MLVKVDPLLLGDQEAGVLYVVIRTLVFSAHFLMLLDLQSTLKLIYNVITNIISRECYKCGGEFESLLARRNQLFLGTGHIYSMCTSLAGAINNTTFSFTSIFC